MPVPLQKRTKLSFLGDAEYYKQNQHLPPGPANLDELAHQGQTLMQRVFQDLLSSIRSVQFMSSRGQFGCSVGSLVRSRRGVAWFRGFGIRVQDTTGGRLALSRTLRMVRQGFSFCHDWAGRQGFEMGLHVTIADLIVHYNAQSDGIVQWRTSEANPRIRTLIENGKLAPAHSFDQASRPHFTDEDMIKMRKKLVTELDENRHIYVKKLHDHLSIISGTKFCRGQVSGACKLHPGADCPVRFEDERPLGQRALSVGAFGSDCLQWTRSGAKLGYEHPAIEDYQVTLAEHTSGVFDWSKFENATDFPYEFWAIDMRRKHRCISARIDNMARGASRPRLYCDGLNMDSIVWIGPTGEDHTDHFNRFFASCAMAILSYFILLH